MFQQIKLSARTLLVVTDRGEVIDAWNISTRRSVANQTPEHSSLLSALIQRTKCQVNTSLSQRIISDRFNI